MLMTVITLRISAVSVDHNSRWTWLKALKKLPGPLNLHYFVTHKF